MSLNEVLQHQHVWRGQEWQQRGTAQGLATGFAELDAELPAGGWNRGALTEILCAQQGIGELSLVLPALARLSRENKWLVFVAPPHMPYAPALVAHGVDISKVLVVHPKADGDALWSVEQALRSGVCGAVLVWPRLIDERSLRRLQLAAEQGNSWGVLFRPKWSASQPSPAALRLRLENDNGRPMVRILKCRGGWPSGPLPLRLHHHAVPVSAPAKSGPGCLYPVQ